jgi:hypothetical protein
MGMHDRMQPFLLSRTYVFAAFGGPWPGVAFLILALSGNLTLGPITPGNPLHHVFRPSAVKLLVMERKL